MYDRFKDIEHGMSDDEIEKRLDEILIPVAKKMAEEDEIDSVLNIQQAEALKYTFQIMQALALATKAKATYEMNEPFKSMGSVSVNGKLLEFNRPDFFMTAIGLASNFNVYPKTNGTVQMDFTFHGMTKPIKKEG